MLAWLMLSRLTWTTLDLFEDAVFRISLILFLVAVTVSVFIARRILDRRSFLSLGLRPTRWMLPDFLFGFTLIGLLMGGIFVLELACGWLTVQGFAWQTMPWPQILWRTVIDVFCFGFFTSWSEELSDRGYWLQNLKEGLNLSWAMVLSSAIFAIRHLANPSASASSTVIIFCAGLFLAYGWLKTGQLWLPLGLHAGWNIFEGIVFGFPVSGFHTFHLIDQTVQGPQWFTGGAFGPESGLVTLLALGCGTVAITQWHQVTRT